MKIEYVLMVICIWVFIFLMTPYVGFDIATILGLGSGVVAMYLDGRMK